MDNQRDFAPAKREGVVFQSLAIAVFLIAGGILFYQAIDAHVGSRFLVYLVLALLLLAPLPVLAYRLYSLLGARYLLERDGLRLRWGLRSEDVPIIDVDWIYPAGEYGRLIVAPARQTPHLPLPWLRWPGALRGVRAVSGLGTIEFLAADTQRLLLVGTARRIYAISPADPLAFVKAFNRVSELGSLSPLAARSVYPQVVVERLWSNQAARVLLIAGGSINLALLVWVLLAIPTRASISLGFSQFGAPLDPNSSERLLLLPVVSSLAFVVDVLFGVYFFRREESKPVAYLLWAASILTGAWMALGIAFILKA